MDRIIGQIQPDMHSSGQMIRKAKIYSHKTGKFLQVQGRYKILANAKAFDNNDKENTASKFPYMKYYCSHGNHRISCFATQQKSALNPQHTSLWKISN